MTLYYTIRGTFDSNYGGNEISWRNYIEWSGLTQLTELVSLDSCLNEVLVEPDYTKDWDFIVVDETWQTSFFTSLDYVIQHTKNREFYNLLSVIVNPVEDCKYIQLENFEFVGYDLLDKSYDISALTNCGGFEDSFLPEDLNNFGLINDFHKAFEVKKNLFINYPEEYHADTNVIAVWRHTKLGRKKYLKYNFVNLFD